MSHSTRYTPARAMSRCMAGWRNSHERRGFSTTHSPPSSPSAVQPAAVVRPRLLPWRSAGRVPSPCGRSAVRVPGPQFWYSSPNVVHGVAHTPTRTAWARI
eukprot:1697119-Pyramimonas_sp.AAC.1